jgi:hypothetical protein
MRPSVAGAHNSIPKMGKFYRGTHTRLLSSTFGSPLSKAKLDSLFSFLCIMVCAVWLKVCTTKSRPWLVCREANFINKLNGSNSPHTHKKGYSIHAWCLSKKLRTQTLVFAYYIQLIYIRRYIPIRRRELYIIL